MGDRQLVAVKAVTGGIDDWSEQRLLPGDVIQQLKVVGKILLIASSPFPGGKSGLQKELRKIHQANETTVVIIKRGEETLEVRACVIVEEFMMRKNVYVLADCTKKNYTATLMDATEEECSTLQEQTKQQLEKRTKFSIVCNVKDCLISYPWQSKMKQFLPSSNSAMVYSLLLMPYQSSDNTAEYSNLEDTTARALAWLSAAQNSGVPMFFVNIQSEPIFMQSSTSKYFTSAANEDPVDTVNAGSYNLHELDGTDINVVRAIRLWYSPPEGELAIVLKPKANEPKLGINITCTEEGFCHVPSVDTGTAADRAGLTKIFKAACAAKKLLVVSRVAEEKITPWFVSSSGAIRCFNATSISEKIAAHRQVNEPIEFHFMLWSGAVDFKVTKEKRSKSKSTYDIAEDTVSNPAESPASSDELDDTSHTTTTATRSFSFPRNDHNAMPSVML